MQAPEQLAKDLAESQLSVLKPLVDRLHNNLSITDQPLPALDIIIDICKLADFVRNTTLKFSADVLIPFYQSLFQSLLGDKTITQENLLNLDTIEQATEKLQLGALAYQLQTCLSALINCTPEKNINKLASSDQKLICAAILENELISYDFDKINAKDTHEISKTDKELLVTKQKELSLSARAIIIKLKTKANNTGHNDPISTAQIALYDHVLSHHNFDDETSTREMILSLADSLKKQLEEHKSISSSVNDMNTQNTRKLKTLSISHRDSTHEQLGLIQENLYLLRYNRGQSSSVVDENNTLAHAYDCKYSNIDSFAEIYQKSIKDTLLKQFPKVGMKPDNVDFIKLSNKFITLPMPRHEFENAYYANKQNLVSICKSKKVSFIDRIFSEKARNAHNQLQSVKANLKELDLKMKFAAEINKLTGKCSKTVGQVIFALQRLINDNRPGFFTKLFYTVDETFLNNMQVVIDGLVKQYNEDKTTPRKDLTFHKESKAEVGPKKSSDSYNWKDSQQHTSAPINTSSTPLFKSEERKPESTDPKSKENSEPSSTVNGMAAGPH